MNCSDQVSAYMNIFFQNKNIQLKQAVSHGDFELVRKFLTVDHLDVNFSSDGQETYLHTAVARNDLSMVRLLLKFKPNLNPILPASNVYSPLWLAMLCSYDDIAELLVRSGADVNERLNSQCTCTDYYEYGGRTSLLHLAITRKNEANVTLLLDYGADVNCQDNGQESALQCAVFREFVTIARILLDRGANLESVNVDGMTALHTALLTGNVKLIQMLIERGANVNAVDNCGKTALHFLAEARLENTDIATQLVNMGLSVNQQENNCGLGPLHVALLTGKENLAKLFVKYGANVSARITGGFHPLCLAVICCSCETMKFLLNKGADVNERTDTGETTLHRAGRFDSAEKIELLLEHGANIYIKDHNGKTALAWVENKSSNAAKALVRQLAKMPFMKESIDGDTMRLIWENEVLRALFEQCLRELKFINNAAFYYKYTLRNLLDESDNKLTVLARNRNFVHAFKSIDFNRVLPNYGKEIVKKFKKAEVERIVVDAMEACVDTVFCQLLPQPIVQQIVKHLNPWDLPNLAGFIKNETPV